MGALVHDDTGPSMARGRLRRLRQVACFGWCQLQRAGAQKGSGSSTNGGMTSATTWRGTRRTRASNKQSDQRDSQRLHDRAASDRLLRSPGRMPPCILAACLEEVRAMGRLLVRQGSHHTRPFASWRDWGPLAPPDEGRAERREARGLLRRSLWALKEEWKRLWARLK
jgi:hypothetical protein